MPQPAQFWRVEEPAFLQYGQIVVIRIKTANSAPGRQVFLGLARETPANFHDIQKVRLIICFWCLKSTSIPKAAGFS